MHRAHPSTMVDHHRSRQGVICGVLAYGLWGLIPLYFKLVHEVAPAEILAHRIFWSFVFLGGVITALGRWADLRAAVRSRPVVGTLAVSTLLLALNWFIYIYAVSTNQVVSASLGYFINPLVNVLLGVVILKERLRGWQVVSVALATVGVAMLGAPPIALSLALTFAFYGLLRRHVAVDGLVGLFVETVLLAPLAVIYIIVVETQGAAPFLGGDATMRLKLMASGIVTAVPLLLFTAAARRLRFSTLGFLQYLAPTLQFLLAVTFFGETLDDEQLTAFGLIWIAVALYSVDSLRAFQQQRAAAPQPVIVDA
jgi:chloramphenicol-sensitive protein RarD